MSCSYRSHCARSRQLGAGNLGTRWCRFLLFPRSSRRGKHRARRRRWERGWARREEKAPTCTSPLSAWPPGARAPLPLPPTSFLALSVSVLQLKHIMMRVRAPNWRLTGGGLPDCSNTIKAHPKDVKNIIPKSMVLLSRQNVLQVCDYSGGNYTSELWL